MNQEFQTMIAHLKEEEIIRFVIVEYLPGKFDSLLCKSTGWEAEVHLQEKLLTVLPHYRQVIGLDYVSARSFVPTDGDPRCVFVELPCRAGSYSCGNIAVAYEHFRGQIPPQLDFSSKHNAICPLTGNRFHATNRTLVRISRITWTALNYVPEYLPVQDPLSAA